MIVLAACGGDADAERAQRDWDLHRGDAWASYEAGFTDGWLDGCKAVFDAVTAARGAAYAKTVVDCGNPPSHGPVVPPEIPSNPEGEGYGDGLLEGCTEARRIDVVDQPGCT